MNYDKGLYVTVFGEDKLNKYYCCLIPTLWSKYSQINNPIQYLKKMFFKGVNL